MRTRSELCHLTLLERQTEMNFRSWEFQKLRTSSSDEARISLGAFVRDRFRAQDFSCPRLSRRHGWVSNADLVGKAARALLRARIQILKCGLLHIQPHDLRRAMR